MPATQPSAHRKRDARANSQPGTPLNKERVLDTAMELADEGGIESLSMRNLARKLGVGVMTLYYYVADKGEILDGIVDITVNEIDLPPANADWKEALRQIAISAHRSLQRHPWAASLMFSTGPGQGRMRYMESVLRTLREGGFSADITHRAYHALESHIIGFTLWQASLPFTAEELPALAADFLGNLTMDQYPYISEHIEQHLAPSSEDEVSTFEFGLELILSALERIRKPD
jgi:AcrR family transcriptional regulator